MRYHAGIYARLSNDSHNEKNESIESQIEIAKAYLKRQEDMELFGYYMDLGRSGTNFEREGFQRLLDDIRQHKVNCVIVKDLSRFGRDYIETGNYIQKVFPFLGVRFIAVTDNFDSLYEENDELGMNLKNLINEMYARDISIKVKSAKKGQRENGSYTGSIPPYGYQITYAKEKRQLYIEKDTSWVVKEIYQLFDSGKSIREIVKWLYQNKVYRPSDYHRYGHAFWQGSGELLEWSAGTVRLILNNPVYIGCLVHAQTRGTGYHIRNRKDLEAEGRSVKIGTHEAIIGSGQFFRVAERLEKRAAYGGGGKGICDEAGETEDIFNGILLCGTCGRRVRRTCSAIRPPSGKRGRKYGYECRNSSRIDAQCCQKRYITYDALLRLVKQALKQELVLNGILVQELTAYHEKNAGIRKKEIQKEYAVIQGRIKRYVQEGGRQYINYRSGQMDREAFQNWQEFNAERIGKLKETSEGLEREMQEADVRTIRQNRLILTMLKLDEAAEPDKELLTALIHRIQLYPDKRVRITFNFTRKDSGVQEQLFNTGGN